MPRVSRWTTDDKIRIVMESLTTNISVAELCRKYNVSPNQYYIWKERFLAGGKQALSSPKDTAANNQLAAENERLKRLIGELTIVNDAFKKTLEGRKS